MEVVELKVRLHCKACEKSVRKALCRIKGATCVEIDVVMSKITVLGYIDRKVVVKAVRGLEEEQSCGHHHRVAKRSLDWLDVLGALISLDGVFET